MAQAKASGKQPTGNPTPGSAKRRDAKPGRKAALLAACDACLHCTALRHRTPQAKILPSSRKPPGPGATPRFVPFTRAFPRPGTQSPLLSVSLLSLGSLPGRGAFPFGSGRCGWVRRPGPARTCSHVLLLAGPRPPGSGWRLWRGGGGAPWPTTGDNHEWPRLAGKRWIRWPATDRSYRLLRSIGPVKRAQDWAVDAL
jgi:hypothetical protein